MRTSDQIYHQVRWDPRFDPARFVLGVSRRGAEPKRIPLPVFVPGGDIPWHRVLFVEADGEVVWDRATGVDRIDATEAGRVRDPRRLRAPFFSARTPFSRAAGTATPSTSLRVLTWNTLWDRFDSDLIATDRRRPLLIDVLEAADADVIALQEVQDELLALLLAAPWIRDGYAIGTDPRRNDVDDCGLLLLSRLPIREAGHHVLGPYKGVAAVVVETGAGPLTIAATHLTSDHSENGAATRVTQLTRIADGLAAVEGDLLLVGDFNDGTSRPQETLAMRDAWLEIHGAGDETPTFDPLTNPLAAVGSLSGRASRLDRILLRSEVIRTTRAALVGDRADAGGLFASDHFGVVADFELGALAGSGGSAVLTFDAVADGERVVASVVDAVSTAQPVLGSALDVAPTARTALAWIPPSELWPSIQAIRRDSDPQVDRWPPHVNILFGFVPESEFETAARLVGDAVRGIPAFATTLRGVRTFEHRDAATVWLDPAADGDSAPWAALRAAVEKRFPGCRGRAEGFTPHLTLGRSRDVQRLVADCGARLGEMSARVGELVLLSRRGDEPMRTRAVVSLETGDVRWVESSAGDLPQDHCGIAHAQDPRIFSHTDHRSTAVISVGKDAGGGARAQEVGAEEARADGVFRAVTEALSEGRVSVVGSRRMGCALPGADLDLVAALPGVVDIAAVARRVAAAVRGASGMRQVIGARVPGLRFRVGDLDVDVVVVATGEIPPAQAVARRMELGEPSAIALSAVSDAEQMLDATIRDRAAFSWLARQVKAWAKARGLDAAPFGGVPGLAWCRLAAETVAAAPDASEAELLRLFFGTWAAWDWRVPIGPMSGDGDTSPEVAHQGSSVEFPAVAPMTILTPSAPVRTCTAQVSRSGLNLIVQELYRAWDILESAADTNADIAPWPELAAPPPMHRRHAAWAVVSVPSNAETLGRVRGRMRALMTTLEDVGVADVHAWPRPCRATPETTEFAIGLGRTPPSAATLTALVRRWAETLPGVSVEWVKNAEVPTLR